MKNYKTKTNLILPFNKKLFVSNGGRSPESNNHIRPPREGPQNQRYAYDFRTETSGSEKTLKDFPVFGIDVLAPAAGVVEQVISGVFEVKPGEPNRSSGVGNAITINHDNGEFSFICHLQHNSIQVKVGDQVKQGQAIARCGNSGNSFLPHIHYHLQDSLYMHQAKGLPAAFKRIKVNGQIKKDYEPIRGEIVSNC